jgi:hypothetical protein
MGETPPLRVWVAVIALSLLITASLEAAFALGLDERYDFAVPSAHARLAAIAKHRHGRLVLIVGSSLVNTAVPSSDYFADKAGGDLQVEVVAVNGGAVDWFNAIRPRIEELNADLLLVQQDLLLPAGKDTRNLLERTNDFLIGWRYVLQSYVLKRRSPVCTSRPLPADVAQFAAYYRSRYDPATVPVAALSALAGLRDGGTQVVLLRIPRFAPLVEAAPNISLWDTAMRLTAEREHLAVWSPPGAWRDPAEFCDVGHMSQVGRAAFGGWLAERLKQELVPR